MNTKNMLSDAEVQKCRGLFDALDAFALKKLAEKEKLPKQVTPNEAGALRCKVRRLWLKDPAIIDQFLAANPATSAEDRELILGWKKNIVGDFWLMKVYPDYIVFLSEENKQKYGTKLLFDIEAASFPVPARMSTALLFYKGIILWDGLASVMALQIGKNMANLFSEECDRDRAAGKIITSF